MMILFASTYHRDSSRLSALRMTYFLSHPEPFSKPCDESHDEIVDPLREEGHRRFRVLFRQPRSKSWFTEHQSFHQSPSSTE
jgi:hypothetical protein